MKIVNLIGSFIPAKRQAPPLAHALRKCLPKKLYLQIIEECPDRRQYSEHTATLLGTNEEVVQRQIATYMKLPFCQRVLPVDIHRLPKNLSLEQFRRSGSIPVISEESLQGIICVDPELAVNTLKTDFDQIFISCWSTISRALSESERIYHEQATAVPPRSNDSDLLVKIITKLVSEAEKFSANELLIDLASDPIAYTVLDPDQKHPKGNISSKCKGILRQALANPELLRDIDEALRVEGSEERFTLKLGTEEAQLSHQELKDEREELLPESTEPPNSPQVDAVELPATRATFKPNLSEAAQPLILVIDDNPVFGQVLERFFERQSLTSTIKTDASSALREITAGTLRPDLIVCDLHMPNLNGLSFCQKLREMPTFTQTPLIMLTSEDDIETEIEALHLGVSLFLRKSQDPRILCAHVSRLVSELKPRKAA